MERNKALALAVLLLPVLATVALAQEAPQLPHLFYGTAQVNGFDLPAGVTIVAKVDGIEVGSITTTEDGMFGGPLASEDKLLVQGDIEEEAEIQFFVLEVGADQTGEFVSGEVEEIGLTWSLPEVLTLEGDLFDQQIVCVPGMTIEIELVQLSLQSTCDTVGLMTINNVSSLGGTYFAGPPGGTVPASSTFEISITGDLDIIVTMTYDDTGINESELQVFKFNGTSWVPIPEEDIIGIDTDANTVTFKVPTSQTPYAIFVSQPQPATTPTSSSGGGGDFGNQRCGNGFCVQPETWLTCPQDCAPPVTLSSSSIPQEVPQQPETTQEAPQEEQPEEQPETSITGAAVSPETSGGITGAFTSLASNPVNVAIMIAAVAGVLFVAYKFTVPKKKQ